MSVRFQEKKGTMPPSAEIMQSLGMLFKKNCFRDNYQQGKKPDLPLLMAIKSRQALTIFTFSYCDGVYRNIIMKVNFTVIWTEFQQ